MSRDRSLARRLRREDGISLVELGLVAMLFLGLTAAAIDFGLGWRAGLAVTEATRTGARVGSALGPKPPDSTGREADYYILSGAKSALTASNKISQVQRVVIFRSTTSDGAVPTACKTGTGDGSCSIIPGAAFQTNWEAGGDYLTATDAQGCMNIATTKAFCPTSRINTPQANAEYLGVWIKIRHPYLFKILGSGVDVSRTTIMRLEPRAE
jgi:Flp pilus assembly protein TadG